MAILTDPFAGGRGQIGSAIASASQQFGGALARLPQVQQQEQFAQQRQESHDQATLQNELQLKKMQDVEQQISENPGMVTIMRDGLATSLRNSMSKLSPKLQDRFGPKVDEFLRSFDVYKDRSRIEPGEASQIVSSLRKGAQILSTSMDGAGVASGAGEAKTQQEFMGHFAEEAGDIPASQVKGMPGFQSRPTETGGPSALDVAKLDDIKADTALKRKKLFGDTDKDTLPREKFKASQFKGLKSTERYIDKQINDTDKEINKNQEIITAFENQEEYTDPKTGVIGIVTDSKASAAQAEMDRLSERRAGLITSRESAQEGFIDTLKPGDTFGEAIPDEGGGEVTSPETVGSFDGGWTLESAKPTKGRIKILSKRMPKYRSIIESAAEKYGIDADVIASVLAQESAFNPKAVGPKTRFGTAKGIAQFIDSTAKQYGLDGKTVFVPEKAIPAAAKYLSDLVKEFGSVEKALAAYNWGPGNLKKNKMVIKPKETIDYVKKIRGKIEYLKGLNPQESEPSVTSETTTGVAATPAANPSATTTGQGRKRAEVENLIRERWSSMEGDAEAQRAFFDKLSSKYADNFPAIITELESKLIQSLKTKSGL